MIIDVQATVERIIALPQLGFKLLERKEEDQVGAVLVTPVDDDFRRNIIVLNTNSVGIGVQAPNAEGKLQVTFNQTPVELIDLLVTIDSQSSVVEQQPEEAPKTKGKK